MAKYRTDGRDVAPVVKTKPKEAPGTLPDGRIPVFDRHGRRRAHVGYKASAATVSRFIPNPVLGKKGGKDCWMSGNVTGGFGSASGPHK